MAKTFKAEQSDIEEIETRTVSPSDRAIRTLKAFQAGTSRQAEVRESLKDLSSNQLFVVSIGTRIPIKALEALRDS